MERMHAILNYTLIFGQNIQNIKDTLYGLKQFLPTESPLKMMKNAFYFTLEAVFVLKIFKFLSQLFDLEGKQLI